MPDSPSTIRTVIRHFQAVANDRPNPCSPAAHLAAIFCPGGSATQGADALGDALGINRAALILVLRVCGAPHDPLRGAAWDIEPVEVFERLLKRISTHQPDTRNADFSDCDLSGADLTGGDFSGSVFERTDLSGARCEQASFRDTRIHSNVWFDIQAAQADFNGAHIRETQFTRCDLSGASLRNARLDSFVIHRSNCRKTDFSEAKLDTGKFAAVLAQQSKFRLADACNVDFSGNFSEADFCRAKLEGCCFLVAYLDGARFDKTQQQQCAVPFNTRPALPSRRLPHRQSQSRSEGHRAGF